MELVGHIADISGFQTPSRPSHCAVRDGKTCVSPIFRNQSQVFENHGKAPNSYCPACGGPLTFQRHVGSEHRGTSDAKLEALRCFETRVEVLMMHSTSTRGFATYDSDNRKCCELSFLKIVTDQTSNSMVCKCCNPRLKES